MTVTEFLLFLTILRTFCFRSQTIETYYHAIYYICGFEKANHKVKLEYHMAKSKPHGHVVYPYIPHDTYQISWHIPNIIICGHKFVEQWHMVLIFYFNVYMSVIDHDVFRLLMQIICVKYNNCDVESQVWWFDFIFLSYHEFCHRLA